MVFQEARFDSIQIQMSVVQYQLQVLYLRDLPAQLAEHSLQIESLLEQYQQRSHSEEQPNSMLDEQ